MTDYDKLLHRHLKLVETLLSQRITVTHTADGEWKIDLPTEKAELKFVNKSGIDYVIIGNCYWPLNDLVQRIHDHKAGQKYQCNTCCDTGMLRSAIQSIPCPAVDCRARGWGSRDPEDDLNNRMFVCNLQLGIDAYDEQVIMQQGYTSPAIRARITPLVRHLLDALQIAIVPAPAKA